MFWTPLFYGALIFWGGGWEVHKIFFLPTVWSRKRSTTVEVASLSPNILLVAPMALPRGGSREAANSPSTSTPIPAQIFVAGKFVESVARQSISSRVSPLLPLLHPPPPRNRRQEPKIHLHAYRITPQRTAAATCFPSLPLPTCIFFLFGLSPSPVFLMQSLH